MSAHPTQATVHELDAGTGVGSVITDQGLVIPFAPDVWESGPLLTMRPGQRVRVTVAGSGAEAVVTSLTLVTFPPAE